MGLGGAHAHASNLVSADSASFPGNRGDGNVLPPPSDVVTVVAVVDGRMRVVDVPRGARLSDVDLASLGGPGDARAAEFSSVVSVAVNREPVPPGAEVAVTLRVGDLVEVTRQAKDRIGQIQMARFNPAHEWYYFPAMEAGEAALIKTYDSATDGRNRFTIHTAFTDPSSPPDAAPRTRQTASPTPSITAPPRHRGGW